MNGSIRLAGSSYANSGRVEVCVNNMWGLICPDNWDNNDVAVVCRQLGYLSSGTYVIRVVAIEEVLSVEALLKYGNKQNKPLSILHNTFH